MQSGTPLHIALLRKISSNQRQRLRPPFSQNQSKNNQKYQNKQTNLSGRALLNRIIRKQSNISQRNNICLNEIDDNICGWFVGEKSITFAPFSKRSDNFINKNINNQISNYENIHFSKQHTKRQQKQIQLKNTTKKYQYSSKRKSYSSQNQRKYILTKELNFKLRRLNLSKRSKSVQNQKNNSLKFFKENLPTH